MKLNDDELWTNPAPPSDPESSDPDPTVPDPPTYGSLMEILGQRSPKDT